jgi:diguanylate cyclase (GGDEF)-like protein
MEFLDQTISRLPPLHRRLLSVAAAAVLLLLISILDYLTTSDVSLALFYLLPIGLAIWGAGDAAGLGFVAASIVIITGIDVAVGDARFNSLRYDSDTIIRASFLLIFYIVFSQLRKTFAIERKLSRTDFLTGAINTRAFCDTASLELDRLRRYNHPFSLIYMDIDNFKEINDRHGHLAGDTALRMVIQSTRDVLRATDSVARLGGDEFAFLLPETDSASANSVARKIQDQLRLIVLGGQTKLTASFGVLTCNVAPDTVDALLQLSDQLMYTAKNQGKQRICFGEYPDAPVASRPA